MLLNGLKEYMHHKNYKALERILSRFLVYVLIETAIVRYGFLFKRD